MGRHIFTVSAVIAFLGFVASVVGQTFWHAKMCQPRRVTVAQCQTPPCGVGDVGGSWQWMASRDEQQRRAAGLYNRYCIRCHGVDGRGVWDVPDVPNFADPIWQSSRTDEQLARLTWEGRGAVMPAFRGTLTWEEAWALAYYIRELVPGSKGERPAKNRAKQTGKPTTKTQPTANNFANPNITEQRTAQLYPVSSPIIVQPPVTNVRQQYQQSSGTYPMYSYPNTSQANTDAIRFNAPSAVNSVPR